MAQDSKLQLFMLICMLLKISKTDANFVLECDFKDMILSYVYSNQYVCNIQNDYPFIVEMPVSSVSGNHIDVKSNNDVTAIVMQSKEIFQIPNFSAIFPNINYIQIYNTSLRSLRRANLEVYKFTLRHLSITNSKVEIIGNDLFKDFSTLETLDLQNNQIFYINENVFNYLFLRVLLLSGNQCRTGQFNELDIGNFEQMNADITLTDYIAQINNSTCRGTSFEDFYLKCHDSKIERDIENYAENKKLIEKLMKCEYERHNITLWLAVAWNNIFTLENQVTELESDNLIYKKNSTIQDYEIANLKTEIEELKLDIKDCKQINGTCRFINDPIHAYTCIAHNILINYPNTNINWTGVHNPITMQNKNVIALKIQNLNVQFIPVNITDQFSHLQSLIINNCNVRKLTKGNFEGFHFVTTIQITSSNVSIIDVGAFDHALSLEFLDLSYNAIQSLPSKTFAKLNNLKSLKLDGNLLSNLATDLLAISNNIKHFSATYNKITKVEQQFVWRLRNVDLIDLSGNNCNQKYDKTVESNFVSFYSYVYYSCSHPV